MKPFSEIKKLLSKFNGKIFLELFLLVVVVFFIRTYNFSEWLLFRADQIRDASIAKEAFDNGIENLRLMGPKIEKIMLENDTGEGDTLNMGPFYYYLQYFSMCLFGTPDPWTTAIPDLLFSILSVPLFYFLLRQFFNKKISFLTTILFAFSFLITQYTRFAWNPNQLFFWEILLLFSMLKNSQNKKNSAKWFMISISALLIISQLHFLAFSGFFLIFLIFYIFISRPKKIKLKHYIFSFLLFILFYTPVILSEIKNNGDNTKRFIAGLNQETSEKGLKENFLENIEKHNRFYLYFPMPLYNKELKGIEKLGGIFILSTLILLVLLCRKKIFSEKKDEKYFLLLTLVYFFAFFLINLTIADRLEKPRYWLGIAPLPFIFLSFWFKLLDDKIKKNKIKNAIFILIISVLCLWNFYGIYWWYQSTKIGLKQKMFLKNPILNPHRDLITLGQMKRAVDYMAKKSSQENKKICHFITEYQIKNGFEYLMEIKYPKIKIAKFNPESNEFYDCLYFVISKAKDGNKDFEDNSFDNFNILESYTDGALNVWDLELKNKDILFSQFPEKNNLYDYKKNKKIYLWKDLWEN